MCAVVRVDHGCSETVGRSGDPLSSERTIFDGLCSVMVFSIREWTFGVDKVDSNHGLIISNLPNNYNFVLLTHLANLVGKIEGCFVEGISIY